MITAQKKQTERQSNASERPKVVVIVGPTASGKTALSIALSKTFNGEVISADSRQVYVGLDIGTGKVTKEEMSGVWHHLLDVADPRSVFSADAFVQYATRAIADCHARAVTPIIAGGTGFYIDALIGRITLGDVPADATLRASLSTYTPAELCTLLQECDPERYADIVRKNEVNNKVRLVRAIEIAKGGGNPHTIASEGPYDTLIIGITHPRDVLRQRINQRLHERIEQGMFAEVQRLHNDGLSWERMDQLGLEYRYSAQYLQGNLTLEKTEEILQQKIWQYARRQLTYWKRNANIQWFKPDDTTAISLCVKNFLTNDTNSN